MIESYGSFYGCPYSEVNVIEHLTEENRADVAFYNLVFLDLVYHEFYGICRDILRYASDRMGQKYPALKTPRGFELVYRIDGNITLHHSGRAMCDRHLIEVMCVKVYTEDKPLFLRFHEEDDVIKMSVDVSVPKYPSIDIYTFQNLTYSSFEKSEPVNVPIFGDSCGVPTRKQDVEKENQLRDKYLTTIMTFLQDSLKNQLGRSPSDLANFCMKVIDKRYQDTPVSQLKELSVHMSDEELLKIINEDWPLYVKKKL